MVTSQFGTINPKTINPRERKWAIPIRRQSGVIVSFDLHSLQKSIIYLIGGCDHRLTVIMSVHQSQEDIGSITLCCLRSTGTINTIWNNYVLIERKHTISCCIYVPAAAWLTAASRESGLGRLDPEPTIPEEQFESASLTWSSESSGYELTLTWRLGDVSYTVGWGDDLEAPQLERFSPACSRESFHRNDHRLLLEWVYLCTGWDESIHLVWQMKWCLFLTAEIKVITKNVLRLRLTTV